MLYRRNRSCSSRWSRLPVYKMLSTAPHYRRKDVIFTISGYNLPISIKNSCHDARFSLSKPALLKKLTINFAVEIRYTWKLYAYNGHHASENPRDALYVHRSCETETKCRSTSWIDATKVAAKKTQEKTADRVVESKNRDLFKLNSRGTSCSVLIIETQATNA